MNVLGTSDTVWLSDLLDRRLHEPVSGSDIAIVEEQLGRYPRGMVAVGARCVCGNPLAVITRPELPGGVPFPTTCYLTSPEAVKAVSHAEGSGLMKQYGELIRTDETIRRGYQRAHELYLSFRSMLASRLGDSEDHIVSISAGGMPNRVKCLHALVAQSLVMGSGVNPIGDLALQHIAPEFSASVCRCTLSAPAEMVPDLDVVKDPAERADGMGLAQEALQ